MLIFETGIVNDFQATKLSVAYQLHDSLSLYLSVRSVQPHSIHFRWICCLLIGISLLIEIVFDGIAFMLLCANFNTLYKDLYKFDFGY